MTFPPCPDHTIVNSTNTTFVMPIGGYPEHELTYIPAEKNWVCQHCDKINLIEVYKCAGCAARGGWARWKET